MTDEPGQVLNFFEHKLRKLSDDDLIQECLIHLKAVELGAVSHEQKERAKLLFREAIKRPLLQFIADDFKIALKVIDKLYP